MQTFVQYMKKKLEAHREKRKVNKVWGDLLVKWPYDDDCSWKKSLQYYARLSTIALWLMTLTLFLHLLIAP